MPLAKQLLTFHLKNFEKYMIFYTLLEVGETEAH